MERIPVKAGTTIPVLFVFDKGPQTDVGVCIEGELLIERCELRLLSAPGHTLPNVEVTVTAKTEGSRLALDDRG